MPAIATIIRKLTKENDKILIQTPVYHVFFYVIEDNNREIIGKSVSAHKNGSYEIDFKDLEEKLADENVCRALTAHRWRRRLRSSGAGEEQTGHVIRCRAQEMPANIPLYGCLQHHYQRRYAGR